MIAGPAVIAMTAMTAMIAWLRLRLPGRCKADAQSR